MKRYSIALALALLTLSFASKTYATQNIVQLAEGNADLSTLVKAVSAAGLVDTLSEEGPFTVFAPTNEAFQKLPAGTLAKLLSDKQALTNVLLYHVIAGEAIYSQTAEGLSSAKMDNGELTCFNLTDGSLFINNAKVIIPDITASNGVVHVIDEVLIP